MAILAAPRASEFISLLHTRLPEKTARHAISVAAWMDAIADAAGVARAPAVYAGLLHDLCKAEKGAALLSRADDYGIHAGALYRAHPGLLHGPVAAEEARRTLGVDDPDVYEAIYWHTTGRPGLGRLGQTLYFADFTEPFRPMPESAAGRALLAREGFDSALRYVARSKLGYVRRKKAVDPVSMEFVEWLEQNTA